MTAGADRDVARAVERCAEADSDAGPRARPRPPARPLQVQALSAVSAAEEAACRGPDDDSEIGPDCWDSDVGPGGR